MHELLNHPAVQGGFIPFLAALAVAELLQRVRLSGLALIAAFAATVYLAAGLSFEPLTATRKIAMLGLGGAAVGVVLTFIDNYLWRPVLTVLGGAAAIWVVERILVQQQPAVALQWAVGCALYTAWLVYALDALADAPVRAGSAALGLGVGTGLAALFGASALLGLYGLSLGAAAFAFLLIQVATNSHLSCGRSFTLPLALITGLTACLAVLGAHLPAYVLPVLGVIPLAARLPVSDKSAVWLQFLLLSAATLACAAIAVYLTWRVAGAPPL